MSPNVVLEVLPLRELPSSNSILQTGFWGEFKERFGWQAVAFGIRASAQAVGGDANATRAVGDGATVLCLLRTFTGGFTLAYVPHGPVFGDGAGLPAALSPDFLSSIARAIPAAVDQRVDLVRFDLPFPVSGTFGRETILRRAPVPVQPPDTVIISLDQSEDAILRQMKSKTRYNVRLAERRGVTVRAAGVSGLDTWYEIYQITARRDGIVVHTKEYYRTLFSLSEKYPAVRMELLLAEVNGEIVAGNIVAVAGDSGYYLFGASSDNHRNLMPTYLLQWEGIKLCRGAGCKRYDLWGIPPSDDPKHPMHGLYRMKTGFGGEMVERGGAWDYLVSPVRSSMYRTAERVRAFYFKRLR